MTYKDTPANRMAIGNGYLSEKFECEECGFTITEDELDQTIGSRVICPECDCVCVAVTR